MRLRILFLSILLIISSLHGAEKLPPIHFTADRVVAAEGVTFISGNVKVFVDDYILTAKQITLFSGKNSRNIYKIKAQGNVKIMGKNRFAVSDIAVFYRESGKVILKGNPRIWEGSDELRGKEIVMYLKKKKIIVKGATGKFSPESINEFGK